jgi:SAM-dependent methyltransferase
MRTMYQTEWQDIQFSDFYKTSSSKLAAPEFYDKFYKEFFRRYNSWEELSSDWLNEKKYLASFICKQNLSDKNILSVGCGLGAIEHYIHKTNPEFQLYIHEVAPTAWRWINDEISDNHKLLGLFPDCLPVGVKFDFIYMSAVDYALKNVDLINLLKSLKHGLTENGRCMIISASLDEFDDGFSSKVRNYFNKVKVMFIQLLDRIGIRSCGQLWGWLRSKEDYHSVMQQAGFSEISSGFINSSKQEHFWITGS